MGTLNVICDYGCGQQALFFFKNGKQCCEKFHQKCPGSKHKWIGKKPWNKGKTKIYNEKTLKKIRDSMKGKSGYWLGKKRDEKTIKKIKLNHSDVSGKKNPNWKGGYSEKNIPLYEFFVDKLTIEEKPKRDKIDKNILTVVCSYCKKRFIPKLTSVYERVRALNGKQYGEQRLYCSNECKQNCSIFNKHSLQQGHPKLTKKIYTNEEYNTWREEVLRRTDYKCEYCGEEATDCHHIKPQKLEPFFSLDPDYGLACCENCHYKYGHKDECSTGQLANIICV